MIYLVHTYWKAFLWSDGHHLTGLAMTLWLLVVSIVLSFILAVPLAIARTSRNRLLSGPVWVFTYLFRGTPQFVQLLIIYSGLASLAWVRHTPPLWSFFKVAINCVILSFVLNCCAYTTEIFAGMIKGTSFGEVEAGLALGMSKFTLYRRIILPSALRRALPVYSNEVIFTLHGTSLAFTATVPDLLKVAVDANSATYMTFQAFGIAALVYLSITFILVGLFRKAERRWMAYLRPSEEPSGRGWVQWLLPKLTSGTN